MRFGGGRWRASFGSYSQVSPHVSTPPTPVTLGSPRGAYGGRSLFRDAPSSGSPLDLQRTFGAHSPSSAKWLDRSAAAIRLSGCVGSPHATVGPALILS